MQLSTLKLALTAITLFAAPVGCAANDRLAQLEQRVARLEATGTGQPATVARTRLNPGPGRNEPNLWSKESRVRSLVTVQNRTTSEIRLVWLDFQGRRDTRAPFERMPAAGPGGAIDEPSWATHTFVVTDGEGRSLCTFTVPMGNPVVDVMGPCP
jgi:hypothetical protein